MSFLDKLDYLMKKRNLNKHQLSQETGIPYSTIDSFYKKGYENIKLSTLQKLSEYFGISLDELTDNCSSDGEQEKNGYYLDEETAKVAQEIFDNPDLRALFSASRKAKPEDLKLAIEVIKKFKGEDSDGDDI